MPEHMKEIEITALSHSNLSEKGCILLDPKPMTFWKSNNPGDRSEMGGSPGLGSRGKGWLHGAQVNLGQGKHSV